MASITSQAKLIEGLQPINSELMPTSKGIVSDRGMHIPDLDLIDGKNIMPTLYGYTSFFGMNSKVGAGVIPTDVQEVLSYRTFAGNTILIALVRDGLFLKALAGDGTGTVNETATEVTIELEHNSRLSWTRILTTIPTGPFENWTHVILRNKLYLYQKGLGFILRVDGDTFGTVIFQKLDPSYIIGNGQKNSFTITIEDDSQQPAGGTYKEFEYLLDAVSLGKFRVDIGTPVKVSRAPAQWENLLSASGLFSAHVEESSRTETDFEVRGTLINHPIDILYPDGINTGFGSGIITLNVEASIDGPESTIAVIKNSDNGNSVVQQQLRVDLSSSNTATLYTLTIGIGTGSEYTKTAVVSPTTIARTKCAAVIAMIEEACDEVLNFITGNYDLRIANSSCQGRYRDGVVSATLAFSQQAISLGLNNWSIEDNLGNIVLSSDPGLIAFTQISSASTVYGVVDPVSAPDNNILFFDAQSFSIVTAGTVFFVDCAGATASYVVQGGDTYAVVMNALAAALVIADPRFTSLEINGFYGTTLQLDNTLSHQPTAVIYSTDTNTFRAIPNIEVYHPTRAGFESPVDGTQWGEPWWLERSYLEFTGFNAGDSSFITVTYTDSDGEFVAAYSIPINDTDTFAETLEALTTEWRDVLEITQERCQVAYTIDVASSQLDDSQVPTTDTDKDGTTVLSVSAITETPDPLAQVDGIMSARDRMGAWTVFNRIHWSSPSDAVDFTPSKTTQANELSVNAVRGNIVFCLGFDNGFIIYATGNVVVGAYVGGQFIFDFKAIEQSSGCIDPRHVVGSLSSHFYWSNLGLQLVNPAKRSSEIIDASLTDWLNKYRFPIQLGFINDRFLTINLQYEPHTHSYRQQRENTPPSAIQDGYLPTPFEPAEIVDFPVVLFGRNLYPTFKRSLVFDILLSRWGTCDVEHKAIFSLNPMNQQGFPIEKDYFLRDATLQNELRGLAIVDTDGYTWLSDTHTEDSYALFGKYATHRYRMTKLVELLTEFVKPPEDTYAQIERTLEDEHIYDITQTAELDQIQNRSDLNLGGKWFNILVRGTQFHLKRLLTRGYNYGR